MKGFSSTGLVLLGAFFVYNVATARAQEHRNVCIGHTTGVIRDVGNCRQYFRCSNNNYDLLGCPYNELFNHLLQKCEYTSPALSKQCFSCPKNSTYINLPADFQPQQYVRCFRGIAEQRVCAAGLWFDPQTRTCNLRDRVVGSCPPLDRPGEPVFVRDLDNCGS